MAIYLSETIRVTAVPRDPDSLDPLDPLPSRAYVDFWAPGVDRRIQAPTIANLEMTRDEAGQRFFLDVTTDTQEWRAGNWVYRVTAADTYRSIEYGQFTISP